MVLPKFTDLSYPTTDTTAEEVQRQRAALLYDYDKQKFIKNGGKFVKTNHIDSIRDWIERNTRTLINTFGSLTEYGEQGQRFGTEFERWIGNSFDPAYVEVVFKKECKRAFERHPEIATITNVKVEFDNTLAEITYKANLIDGTDFSGKIYIGG